ncbi:unnamed protein product [Dracunculus medinensis]|uniref:Venom peptide n=1 Tax=Dracunculus medinensis TaxID=318479 RepID=A0A0N4U9H3_DRAME|nr:unnamed protein product [Dracunculus medinensis]
MNTFTTWLLIFVIMVGETSEKPNSFFISKNGPELENFPLEDISDFDLHPYIVAYKRAMMRLGKRSVFRFGKRALMRLG